MQTRSWRAGTLDRYYKNERQSEVTMFFSGQLVYADLEEAQAQVLYGVPGICLYR